MLDSMLSLIALLSISIVYLTFDLFNDRSIPDLAVYSIFIISLLVSFEDNNFIGIALCSVILSVGYIVYRKGIIGLGDIYEISSVFLISSILFDINFISDMVYMNAIIIDIYYLLMFYKNGIRVNLRLSYSSMIVVVLFTIIFIFDLNLVYLPLMVSVIVLLLIKSDINRFIVRHVDVEDLRTGDILAHSYGMGLGHQRDKKLIDKDFISYLKSNHMNGASIYANAFPFTITIFISIILSILIGNIWVY